VNVTNPVETTTALSFEVGGADRSGLYRAAIAAVLEALYGDSPAPPPADGSGVVPLQAAGHDEAERLGGLLAELLREAPLAPGRLLPPSWLSFDERRATATFRVGPAGAPPRAMSVSIVEVRPEGSAGLSATIALSPA